MDPELLDSDDVPRSKTSELSRVREAIFAEYLSINGPDAAAKKRRRPVKDQQPLTTSPTSPVIAAKIYYAAAPDASYESGDSLETNPQAAASGHHATSTVRATASHRPTAGKKRKVTNKGSLAKASASKKVGQPIMAGTAVPDSIPVPNGIKAKCDRAAASVAEATNGETVVEPQKAMNGQVHAKKPMPRITNGALDSAPGNEHHRISHQKAVNGQGRSQQSIPLTLTPNSGLKGARKRPREQAVKIKTQGRPSVTMTPNEANGSVNGTAPRKMPRQTSMNGLAHNQRTTSPSTPSNSPPTTSYEESFQQPADVQTRRRQSSSKTANGANRPPHGQAMHTPTPAYGPTHGHQSFGPAANGGSNGVAYSWATQNSDTMGVNGQLHRPWSPPLTALGSNGTGPAYRSSWPSMRSGGGQFPLVYNYATGQYMDGSSGP